MGKNKRSGLGPGLNNTLGYKPPKSVMGGEELTSKAILDEEKELTRLAIRLSKEEGELIKAVSRRNNVKKATALHIILADYARRHPDILDN